MTALVVGIGNPDRGDDAAGLLVARQVRGVEAREARGEVGELLELMRGRERVYLVDAVCSGARPGTLYWLEGPLPAFLSAHSTHGLGLAEAVELARLLGTLPPELVVVGIEGESFGLGEPLSEPVRTAISRAARRIERAASASAARPASRRT